MTTSSSDLAARVERLRALTVGRSLGTALIALVLVTIGRDLVPAEGWGLLAAVTTVHLGVQLVVLLTHIHGEAALRVTLEVTLVVDLVSLGLLMALTGGTSGPLNPVLLIEIVAVTLLFGRWAGFRAALLGSVIVVWLLFAGPPGLVLAIDAVGRTDPALAATLDPGTRAVLLLVAMWATTLVTAWLAGVTERDLRRRTADLALLHDVTPELDPRQGPGRVCEVLADTLVERLRYPASAVWLATDEGTFAYAAGRGGRVHPSIASERQHLDPDDPTIAEALAGGSVQPLRRDDSRPSPLLERFGRRAPLVLVPLRHGDRPVALLVVEAATRLRWGRGRAIIRARDLQLLRMLAEQAALLVGNALTQSDLADLAITDAITGLPNHRYLQQRLDEELERVSRAADAGDDRVLSFALFDLDHFKLVNDTYGHQTGDRVLAAVAAVADRTLRGSDVVCRYGGEEFAIVLVDTGVVQARRACERVRQAIAGLPITSTDGQDLPNVTASFGIATVVGRGTARTELIGHADAALYAAKEMGRDRVVHHDDHAEVVVG